MSTTVSDADFAAGAYALMIQMKVANAGDPEAIRAINAVMATASPSVQRRGREAYGQIMEALGGL
jgi:hypothetical protein